MMGLCNNFEKQFGTGLPRAGTTFLHPGSFPGNKSLARGDASHAVIRPKTIFCREASRHHILAAFGDTTAVASLLYQHHSISLLSGIVLAPFSGWTKLCGICDKQNEDIVP
jgi:hypothetical protein